MVFYDFRNKCQRIFVKSGDTRSRQQMFDEITVRIESPQILRNKLRNTQKNIHDGEINWIGKQSQQLKLKGVTLERTLSRNQGLKSRF